MKKTVEYYNALQDAETFIFRLQYKEYFPKMPCYTEIQKYDLALLKLNINDVVFEIKHEDAVRETQARFSSMLGYKTDCWLELSDSVLFNHDVVVSRLKDEGYIDTDVYMSYLYRLQSTIFERIEFIRRAIEYFLHRSRYNGKSFEEMLSPKFSLIGIDENGLKTYFKISFFGGMGSNYFLSYTNSLKRDSWSDKEFACIAYMTYNSKFLLPKMKPQTFKKFYEQFCNIVGCQYHEDYKPNKLKEYRTTNNRLNEFSYLERE